MYINWHSNSYICQNDNKFTYQELLGIVKRKADYLTQSGVRINDRVVVYVKNDINSLANILAVNHLGAVFIPIDDNNDGKLIDEICNENLAWAFNLNRDNTITIIPSKTGKKTQEKLAYIIYTSGSTGKRKGVMISEKNVSNYVEWFVREFAVAESDTTYISTSIAYDLSYSGLFTALFSGSNIIFPNNSTFEITDLEYAIKNLNVTYIKVTPSIIQMLVSRKRLTKDNCLRLVISGGENINPLSIMSMREMVGDQVLFVNHYGPTETTIGCCCKVISFDNDWDDYSNNPSVGKPIDNTSIKILHEGNLIEQSNIEGEVFISGYGVGMGYVDGENRGFRDGGYYSGDIGKYNDNYELVLCGRKNNIVKINGYRTTLDELQRYMNTVKLWDCSIVVKNENANRIEVYYKNTVPIERKRIIDELKRTMPTYLIPKIYYKVSTIPQTPNGKVNTKELINNRYCERDDNHKVYSLFDSICPLGDCSYYSSRECTFDELGIDSLSRVLLVSGVESYFGVNIPLQLSKTDTIANVVKKIEKMICGNPTYDTISCEYRNILTIDDMYDYLIKREKTFQDNISHVIEMNSTQKYYCRNNYQLDNILHSCISFAYNTDDKRFCVFLNSHICFHGIYDTENEIIKVSSINTLILPYYEVIDMKEYELLIVQIMKYLKEHTSIPYIIMVISHRGQNYFDCYYNHYAILDKDIVSFRTNDIQEKPVDLDKQPNLDKSYISVFTKWLDISQKFTLQSFFSKANDNCISDIFVEKIDYCFNEAQLAVAISLCLGEYLEIDSVPIVILRDHRNVASHKFLGDQTDYLFIVVNIKKDILTTIKCVADNITAYDSSNQSFFDNLDEYDLLDKVPLMLVSINVLTKDPAFNDSFIKNVNEIHKKHKKKIRNGISLFSIIDIMNNESFVSLGTNISENGFIDYCRYNFNRILKELEALG